MRAALALLALLVMSAPAWSEALIVTLSRPTIAVRSNFAGTQIVVFGGIERDGGTVARQGYDVVAVVRGPADDTVVRRKDRVLGMWINRSSETYRDLPGYYAVLSSRPLGDIATDAQRTALGLGAATLVNPIGRFADAEAVSPDGTPTLYGAALIETRAAEGLYVAIPDGVTFLGRSMFRGTAILPASVPIGTYHVDVHLFSGGALLKTTSEEFLLHKVGFEEVVSSLSRERPAVYGIATIALAFFTGWLGSVVFRRD